MKKIVLILVMILLLPALSYAGVDEGWATLGNGPIQELTLTITADGAGAVTNYDVQRQIDGCLFYVVTNPGTPAPTDNYDITFIDEDSIDQAGGQLANRDTTNTENVKITTVRCMEGVGTLTVSNNSVGWAVIVIKLFFGR